MLFISHLEKRTKIDFNIHGIIKQTSIPVFKVETNT
jgi:hypothetical protein